MSSGHKRDNANLRERLVSGDRNRLQAFIAADRSEAAKLLLSAISAASRPMERGAPILVGDIPTTVDDPLRGDVFEGLVVTPIVGTTSLHISPGVVGLMDPDGQAGSSVADPPSPDDSPYKIVSEPTGIQTNGVLTMGANAGPGARFDVIECRRNEQVLETDVRDIFDPSSGTSTPLTVDKVLGAALSFRVRTGVAGAGFPGTALGWLPLAVAYVPSGGGATTNDIDFWDVRPLVKDRVRQPYRSSWSYGPAHELQQLFADIITVPAETRISGNVFTQLNGMLAGGEISRGSPGADQAYIDAQDSEWWEPGFTCVIRTIVYLYLAFPHGLPRWVRYNRTPAAGLRFPDGMRGIPIISVTPPTQQGHGGPVLSLPAFFDGGTTPDTVLAAAFTGAALDTPGTFVAGGEWVDLPSNIAPAALSPPFNGTGNAFDIYQLVAGTDFPRDARKVRVVFEATFTGVNGTNLIYDINAGANHLTGVLQVSSSKVLASNSQFDVAASITLRVSVDIERIPEQSGLGSTLNVRVAWNAAGFVTKINESAQVIGWKQTG